MTLIVEVVVDWIRGDCEDTQYIERWVESIYHNFNLVKHSLPLIKSLRMNLKNIKSTFANLLNDVEIKQHIKTHIHTNNTECTWKPKIIRIGA